MVFQNLPPRGSYIQDMGFKWIYFIKAFRSIYKIIEFQIFYFLTKIQKKTFEDISIYDRWVIKEIYTGGKKKSGLYKR
ncbi:MAG: hypothetical protein QXO40_01535 [Candidatus Aenigmatarchaeota archaeon]